MSDTTSYPELSVARRAQIVIAVFALFASMDENVVSLLLEPIKHDLGLSDVEVGLANSSARYLGYALFSIPMGLLVDRITRVRLLIASAVLWCLSLLLTGLSSTLGMLVAAKGISGVANALTGPASLSLLSDYFAPDRRGMAIGTYTIGQVAGGSAAIIVGGLGFGFLSYLSVTHPGALFGIAPWRCVPLAFALCGIGIIPFLAKMREPVRQEVGESGSSVISELWGYRAYLIPLVGVQAFIAGGAIGIMNWIPTALQRIYGQSSSDFALWYSTLSLVSGIGGILLAANLVPRWLRQGQILLAGVGAAGLFGLSSFIALMPNIILFALCYVMLIVAYMMAAGITVLSIAYRMPNELRGAALAISAVAVSITGAIGAPLMAWASDIRGGGAMIGQGMTVVGIAGGLLSALSVISLPRRRLSAQDQMA